MKQLSKFFIFLISIKLYSTEIKNGGDSGSLLIDDTPGDVLLWYSEAISTTTSNITKVVVTLSTSDYRNEVIYEITKASLTTTVIIFMEDGNPDDGETSIQIPPSALDQPTTIKISRIDVNDPSVPNSNPPAITLRPIQVYKFEPSGLVFNFPATLTLLYFPTEYDEKKLAIFYWDSFRWRWLGGNVDINKNTISTKIQHFSLYAIFPVGSITNSDYRPKEKIITPANVDSKNDFATFGGITSDDTINIYDISGRKIRTIQGIPSWDGKDEDRKIVESGIYIYQIRTKDRIISGTIGVAK